MKNKILGWIAIAWGGLILVTGIVNITTGRIQTAGYAAGQAVALGFAVVMLYAGIRALWLDSRGSTPHGTVRFTSDDREMDAAIETARQSFGDFVRAFQEPGEQQHSFQLKVFFSDDGEAEHIWVADLETTDAGFRGVLANEPLMTSLRFKQSVEFEPSRITDWMFIDHGALIGGFTTRLIRQRLNPEERAAFDATHPYSL